MRLSAGERVPLIAIGTFTGKQFDDVNAARCVLGLHHLERREILYIGRHHHGSRSKDGYTCEDMFLQIQAALSEDAVVLATSHMTALNSSMMRANGYGNAVKDRAIFELTQRKPRAELFSAIPKGDPIKPNAKGPTCTVSPLGGDPG